MCIYTCNIYIYIHNIYIYKYVQIYRVHTSMHVFILDLSVYSFIYFFVYIDHHL